MVDGTVIGPVGMRALVATDFVLYAVDANALLQQYQNAPGEWSPVGPAAAQYVAGATTVYQLASDGTVSAFDGATWNPIGTGMARLVAGGDSLYGVATADGTLWAYEGVPGGWTPIAQPGGVWSTNGEYLFGTSADGSTTSKYVVDPPSWVPIGGALTALFTAPNALYGVRADGALLRWNGTPDSWVEVGNDWGSFAAVGLSLYAIAADGSVTGEFDGVPGSWTPFAGPATAIAATLTSVYLATPVGVVEYDVASADGGSPAVAGAPSAAAVSATSWVEWTWSFRTSNRFFSGYDGEVRMTLFWPPNDQQSIRLPFTSFQRGTTRYAKLGVATSSGVELTGISLSGQDNFFGDHWTVDTVTAFDPSAQLLYRFDFDTDVPNDGSVYRVPASTTTLHQHPGLATVFVWDFLGKDVAWGHASIELDDGTYISWWPQGLGRKSMPLLPDVYTVAAIQPRTFRDDVEAEDDTQPQWRVAVGGLDHKAIRAWWASFKTTHKWSTLSQNCSTTVADALWAGGAASILTAREDDMFQGVVVWTPNDVLALATAINAHTGPTLPA